jgi:hypothetical protein
LAHSELAPKIFIELRAVNGLFEEPWMAAFNTEVWGDNTLRNDARGTALNEVRCTHAVDKQHVAKT